jgi:hypothetical protein
MLNMTFATKMLLDNNFSYTEDDFVDFIVTKKLKDIKPFLQYQITEMVLTKIKNTREVSLKSVLVKEFFTSYVYNEARYKEEMRAREIYKSLLHKKK